MDKSLLNEKEKDNQQPQIASLPKSSGLYVVGIGASAGGLEAMRELLANLDFNPRLSYVVAQHLSPTHTSMLKTLLARECKLNVEELTENQVPEGNTIYITPPSSDVEIRDGVLRLVRPKPGIGPKPNIDRFFSSLALDLAEYAIGIILSGTGGDGASGLLAIKSAGGTTFVQDPATAKYDGMPQAAIQCSGADVVLPAAKISNALIEFAANGALISENVLEQSESIYEKIVALTKDVTGFNLSQYKKSTIERRIKRRMALYHHSDMDQYLEQLQANIDEVEYFAKDVLISVTEFFRDPEAFESLAKQINTLVENAPLHQTLRAWVPGCATGEEAYSIAILFEDAIRKLGKPRNYQVFASDIDINAANRGRAGRYPSAAFEKMDPEIRERFFRLDGGEFVATKSLREHIVFSVHNLIQDPPFSRVDLISCRNLLIYFTSPLQKRVLEIFHYALNPNGILFLGKSETVGQHEELFSSLNKKRRIYRKLGDRRIYRPFSAPIEIKDEGENYTKAQHKHTIDPISIKLDRAIQKAFGPPSVVISSNDEVIHSIGEISEYLSFHAGSIGLNIYNLVDDKLRAELRALVYKCRREQTPVYGGRHILNNTQDLKKELRISVRPLEEETTGLLLICFEAQEDRAQSLLQIGETADAIENPIILELEHELTTTREHLQTVVEELETSNEELQSLNEELQSSNEELQSTNEELQTSNEELQSTNEELLTVNDELNVKSRELETLASDLQNIQDSVDFPLIVVDKLLRVTRFVPAVEQVVPAKEIHLGDAITSLAWREDIPRLRPNINKVIKSGKVYTEAIQIRKHFYQLRIVPYFVKGDEIAGAVLLFPETTELHETKLGLQQSEMRLQNIIDTAVDGIVTIDERGTLLSFSKAAEDIFGYKSSEVVGNNVNMLMPEPYASEHNIYLKNYLTTGQAKAIGTQREVQGKHKDGHIFPLELSVNEMRYGHKRNFIALVRDITERKQLDENLFKEKERALVTLHSIADGVITTDREGRVQYVNSIAEKLTGWSNDDAQNEPVGKILKIIDEYTRDPKTNPVRMVLEKKDIVQTVNGTILRSKNNKEFAIEHNASPIFNRDGEIDGVIVVFRDVTEKYQILKQMAWQAHHDPLTGLINRREMENRIEAAITSAKSFKREHALLYIDLDQFKVVNDTCGHQAGDELLRQVAGHLAANVRHRDALSRLGGDEFGMLLENCTIGQAQQVAESIKENVDDFRFSWDKKVFKIGCSIGVVNIDSDSIDKTQVLSDADTACYAAKEDGRNRVKLHLPDDAGLAKQRREMHWVTNINQVLDENRFRLYFQRIQAIKEEKQFHWEILLRMLNDDGGIILPGVFLPAAERYGLMPKIDRWVIRSAFTILGKVPSDAKNISPNISINLSGTSLGEENFLNFVIEQFNTFNVDPSQICFEITETAAIANFARAKNFITSMKKIGCQFALDDFGSGMSSFGYLKNLAVDYIKIDGTFVRNINNDIVDLAMIESINRIGNLMEIETVAEFAESEAILQKLKLIGVGYAQGYGVQRPIPTEEFLVSV